MSSPPPMPAPHDPFRTVLPSVSKKVKNENTRKARDNMVAVVDQKLAAHANGQSVAMGWSKKTYTKMVAAGHKIVGFPETEVFTHPNYIRGGIAKLEELTEKWVSGEISFADARENDIRDAEHNRVARGAFPGKWVEPAPMKVMSDFASLPSSNVSRPPPPGCPKELVLRVTSLAPCFVLPIADAPNPDAVARMQRSDTKTQRSRSLRGSRAGIKTKPFIVPSPAKIRGEPAAKRLKALPTHDRIDQAYSVPEIEGREDLSDPIESCDGPWFASSQALAMKRKVRVCL
ncbi:hypothetical protein OH76DRAFT_1423617 [Lentinus brumalis]|uniref:Uncharacterized protein n=1 Tax=Lentinus brumalis TaxID=2498619 RepID=A0A371CJV0_9APHY|nr:hypothetical protein OH76DRAFT_1423617 [Polyporus brumalis]